MLNSEARIVYLDRLHVCDVLMAITHIRIDFMNEIRDENITEERRKIAENSLKKWESLHEKIKKQLDLQDSLVDTNVM